MTGQDVQLQRKSGGDWTTLQKLTLLGGSKVIFTGPLPTSTLRAAISVNQAGVGYLGATSHSLAYRAQQ